ncbi:uncharacterized protein C22orf31-like isoform X1 [Scomber scombrus]|uniref:Uncharacterized protein C22orf31-like isoform X1 n=1 Tax=Scomber scombrus TaxID=13677 RepID=A0AAV1Q9K1_SCOSC
MFSFCISAEQEVTPRCQPSSCKPVRQIKQSRCSRCSSLLTSRCSSLMRKKMKDGDVGEKAEASGDRQPPLLIHGLNVERYKTIYNSVLTPSALSALATAGKADYVAQTLEVKQRLWTTLSQPRLQEREMEDGRVEVTEILDLT